MAEKKTTAFEKALTQAVLSRYQAQLDADDEPVEFSEAHKAAVEKLTKKTKRKSWKYVNTTAKRILIAAILVGLLAATAFAAVPALRGKQVKYEEHNDGVAVNFEFSQIDVENAPKEILTYYAPTYIPDGYTLTKETNVSNYFCRYYNNSENNYILFKQFTLWDFTLPEDALSGDGNRFVISGDYDELETLIVDGYEVRVYHYYVEDIPERDICIWTDYNYFFVFEGPNFSKSTISKIISSIETLDP